MKKFKFFLLMLLLISHYSPAIAQNENDKKAQKEARKQAEREQKEFEKNQRERYKYFSVTSEPEGAKVEINGEDFGTTPVKRDVNVKFFYNGPSFAFSSYLSAHLNMTVSKEGYVAKTVQITRGPYWWISIDGTNRLLYYVVESPEYHIKLEPVGQFPGRNPFNNEQSADEKYDESEQTEKTAKVIVQITSEPAGAEIYIDDKFVGSTPSKLNISPGEHKIRISRTGFKDWERSILIETESEPSFNAILEKSHPLMRY